MPNFMDFHDDLKLPSEVILQDHAGHQGCQSRRVRCAAVGAVPQRRRQGDCLLEAPDADAVRNHHAALGVPCGEVHEVSQLL
jgi:hypothetical protein